MTDLIEKKCVPCEGGMPALNFSEIHKYQKKLMVGKLGQMKKKYFFWKKNLNLKIF